jgi:hypothetical protein
MPKQVKVNVDDSFHLDDHAGSAKVVIRHFEGRFIVASSLYLPNISKFSLSVQVRFLLGVMGCLLFEYG